MTMTEFNATNNTVRKNGILKEITPSSLENISEIDLSNRNLSSFNELIKLPSTLTHLNLSHNYLNIVPDAVVNLENIKALNLSSNKITCFDDTPSFCHSIVYLNLANNSLCQPPYWVWSKQPESLEELDISNNRNLCRSLINENKCLLLELTVTVKKVKIFNCNICYNNRDILQTLQNTKELLVGVADYSVIDSNQIEEFPCKGLNADCDIERLNLCNISLYNINTSICNSYRNLLEINLSINNISSLPQEFCKLENLQICKLSFNKLIYLPDQFVNMHNLEYLHLDSNELCMLPNGLCNLPKLKYLDVYSNKIDFVPEQYLILDEIDLAQNYFNEPQDEEYMMKKSKLRMRCNSVDRVDGNILEIIVDNDESYKSEDEDNDFDNSDNIGNDNDHGKVNYDPDSQEDWDSDDHWEPNFFRQYTPSPPPQKPWTRFALMKMEEGNFCPMDLHTIPIIDQVNYYKMCHPQDGYISDGQFDDLTDDDI